MIWCIRYDVHTVLYETVLWTIFLAFLDVDFSFERRRLRRRSLRMASPGLFSLDGYNLFILFVVEMSFRNSDSTAMYTNDKHNKHTIWNRTSLRCLGCKGNAWVCFNQRGRSNKNMQCITDKSKILPSMFTSRLWCVFIMSSFLLPKLVPGKYISIWDDLSSKQVGNT